MQGGEAISILLVSSDAPGRRSWIADALAAPPGGQFQVQSAGLDQAEALISAGGNDVTILVMGEEPARADALKTFVNRFEEMSFLLAAETEEPSGEAAAAPMFDVVHRSQLASGELWRLLRHAARRTRELRALRQRLAESERQLQQAVEERRLSNEALTATQLQLLQVEKMESVGRLAAGIAHEVKNPLAIIATGIEYLKQSDSTTREMLARVLGSMSRAVLRADSVIRGLLDFSAPAALRAEPCDLNSVVRQALVLVDHELLRCNIELHTELAEALPPVSIDANKVEQVFLNLFINAIHAMPAGGKLTVRTLGQQMAALGHFIGDNRAERFRAGDHVVVAEVDDTGHGIPEEQLGKVFDPFFTTKPTGKGTGLGLSVAKTIVELHGGLLQLSNRPEGGVRSLLVLKSTQSA